MDARQRIIRATIRLLKQKGLKATTTRAIAQAANVNEVTLFRQFGSKRNLFQTVLSTISYRPDLNQLLTKPLLYELEPDLLFFAKLFQDVLSRNRDLILILLNSSQQERQGDSTQDLKCFPQEMKHFLSNYFTTMQQKGRLAKVSVEPQVLAFISLNLGYFFSKTHFGEQIFCISEEDFLHDSVKTFSKGLSL